MSGIHVFDPEGDLILKIIEGLEHTVETKHMSCSRTTNNGEIDNDSKLQDLLCQLPNLYLSEYEEPRVVMARVSKEKLCNTSRYFKAMLTGGFSETQQQFTRDNPCIIKLEEVDCDAALAMLALVHRPDTFRAQHSFTFDTLMDFTALAEYWDMTPLFHSTESAWKLVDNVFRTLKLETVEQRTEFFQEQLVDLFDAAEVLNDRPAYSTLGTFVLKHLCVSDQFIFRPRFMTTTKTAEILINLESRIDYIKSQVVTKLLEILKRSTGQKSDQYTIDSQLIPIIKRLKADPSAITRVWPHDDFCLRAIQKYAFLLPLIDVVDFNRVVPYYTGSLQELCHMHETLNAQPGFNDIIPYWCCTSEGCFRAQDQHWAWCCQCSPSLRDDIYQILRPVRDCFRTFCIECFDEGMRGDHLFSKEVRCEHWYTINWLDRDACEKVRQRHERNFRLSVRFGKCSRRQPR